MSESRFGRAMVAGVLGTGLLFSAAGEQPQPSQLSCIEAPVLDNPAELPLPQITTLEIQVGTIAIQDGKITIDQPDLPDLYKQGILAAAAHPYTGCVWQEYAPSTTTMLSAQLPEEGSYAPPRGENKGVLNVVFGDKPDPKDQKHLFNTAEDIQTVFGHEATHAMFINWTERAATDPKAKELLNAMETTYKQGVYQALEAYRQTYGESTTKALADLHGKLVVGGEQESARVIKRFMEKLQTEGGLQGTAFNCDDPRNRCQVRAVSGMLLATANEERTGLVDSGKMQELGFDVKRIVTMNNQLQDLLERRFADHDETATIGWPTDAGHPSSNFNEDVTSLIISDTFNPRRTIDLIRALPPEQKALAIEQRQNVVRAVAYLSPHMLPRMGTPYVLSQM